MRVIVFLFGVILLLPGACALVSAAVFVPDMLRHPSDLGEAAPLTLLWLFCFAVSFGGILMIRRAMSKSGKTPPEAPIT
jgi:hypothetical protein